MRTPPLTRADREELSASLTRLAESEPRLVELAARLLLEHDAILIAVGNLMHTAYEGGAFDHPALHRKWKCKPKEPTE